MVCKVRSCLTVKIWQGLASLWQGFVDGNWLGQGIGKRHSKGLGVGVCVCVCVGGGRPAVWGRAPGAGAWF